MQLKYLRIPPIIHTLRLATPSWSHLAGPPERTPSPPPPRRVPVPLPLQETPPQIHRQVNPFAASEDSTSWEDRPHDVLVDALLNQILKHLRDVLLDLRHEECRCLLQDVFVDALHCLLHNVLVDALLNHSATPLFASWVEGVVGRCGSAITTPRRQKWRSVVEARALLGFRVHFPTVSLRFLSFSLRRRHYRKWRHR